MLKKQYVKSRNIWKVTFELLKDELPESLKAECVHLVGEFNDWDTNATPMKRGEGGAYRVLVELEPGREFQFRYCAHGHQCYVGLIQGKPGHTQRVLWTHRA